MSRWVRRVILLTAVVVAVAPGGVAFADPAAPSDYRSTIVSIEPEVEGLDVSIEGGDSFVRLRAPTGSTVTVLGYEREPYLRFEPDGVVSENVRSPATYENEQRYGVSELPDVADADAPPQWRRVAGGGVWSWHDHRAHWMVDEPPVGLQAGESLPAQTIPVEVDGQPVSIVVVTTLVGGPSPWPALLGALAGLQLVLLGWWLGPATATLATAVIASAALGVGGAQFLSLPAETEPRFVWWLMPGVAVAAIVAAIATYGRSAVLLHGLVALAGVQLALWAVVRRTTLTKPVLPTDVPFWFDRVVTAGALTAGGAIAALSLWTVLAPPKPPPR